MTIVKYVTLFLIFALVSVAAYVAWQNRASEKVITSFLSLALVGATGVLISTLFSIKTETDEAIIYKTYFFHQITKQPLDAWHSPVIHELNGRETHISTALLAQGAVERDPSLGIIEETGGNSRLVERGSKLYKEIFFYQLAEQLCAFCDVKAGGARRSKAIAGGTTVGPANRSSKIPSREILWSEIQSWNTSNSCLQATTPHFFKTLSIPRDATITSDGRTFIQIQDRFIDLSITIRDGGGGLFYDSLRPLIESREEAMKHWALTQIIEIKAKYKPIRSGHPLMQEYKNWIKGLITELDYQFNSVKHLEQAKEVYLLNQGVPEETTKDIITAQNNYMDWLKNEYDIQEKKESKNIEQGEIQNKSSLTNQSIPLSKNKE